MQPFYFLMPVIIFILLAAMAYIVIRAVIRDMGIMVSDLHRLNKSYKEEAARIERFLKKTEQDLRNAHADIRCINGVLDSIEAKKNGRCIHEEDFHDDIRF